MQKMVLALDLHDDNKCKKKAMKIVSSIAGIDSISVDIIAKKLTLVGNMDPTQVVNKLRKTFHTEIVTVGPAIEAEEPKPTPEREPEPITQTYVHVPWPPHNHFFPNYIYYY